METIYLVLIFAGFLLSIAFTKVAIVRLVTLGLTSRDLHKANKPRKPKTGGIAIAGAFSIVSITAFILNNSIVYLVLLLTFLVAALVGLMDDFIQFGKLRKLLFPGFAAIPLLWLISWEVGTILLLFLLVTVASNWTNMLAGFNGLETGLGAIALFFLALNTTSGNTSFILFAYSVILLGFLFFNKYPAKIFPGDVGTLPIGAVLVASTFLGAPLLTLIILMIPYGVDAALKLTSAGVISSSDFRPTRVKKGYLIPEKNYLSLSRVMMGMRPLKEWQLVSIIWGVEIGLGIVTLII